MTKNLKGYREIEQILNDFKNQRIGFSAAIEKIEELISLGQQSTLQEVEAGVRKDVMEEIRETGLFKVRGKWYVCGEDSGSFCSEICAEKNRHINLPPTLKIKDK